MPKRSSRKKAGSSRHKAASPKVTSAKGPQRLQRFLAAAGFGSRRQCEELIQAGRVMVNGDVQVKLGSTVDAAIDKVHVDGVLLRPQKKVYYAVNKPTGVVTTNRDPHGRPRVIDLVPKSERIFPVGRLDRSSEGLILLTNDGDLAQMLAHPKFGVRKVYRVTVAGRVESETMRNMRKGVYIAEGHVKVEGAKILKAKSKVTELEIVLREGKNREIRRILARLGHKVQTLRRIAIGPLRLGDVPSGAYRLVSKDEVRKLYAAAEASRNEGETKLAAKEAGRRPVAGNRKRAAQRSAYESRSSSPSTNRSAAKKTKRGSRKEPEFNFSFESDSDAAIGSVIGGDSSSEDRPQRGRAGVKRSAKKRTASKQGGSKRATSKRSASAAGGRPVKRKGKKKTTKKKATPSSNSARRGAARVTKKTAGKTAGKGRRSKKTVGRKRKR